MTVIQQYLISAILRAVTSPHATRTAVLLSRDKRTDQCLVDIYFQDFRDYLRFNESDALVFAVDLSRFDRPKTGRK